MLELPLCYSIVFPTIDPIFFKIGSLQIHWYGLGYLVAILFCWRYSVILLEKKTLWQKELPPFSPRLLDDFVLWATVGVVVGGRLGNVLFWSPSYYFRHPFEIIAIWHGGMAFHGGFLGMIVAMCLFAYRHKLNVLNLFDLIAAGVPVGLFLVRLCNFINGELWGKPSSVAWAMIFPRAGPLPRHPSQLYEATTEGLLLFLLLTWLVFYCKSFKKPGLVSAVFLLGYSIARIGTEIFREPDAAPLWFSKFFNIYFFSYGMFLCIPMLIAGAFLFYYALRKKKDEQT